MTWAYLICLFTWLLGISSVLSISEFSVADTYSVLNKCHWINENARDCSDHGVMIGFDLWELMFRKFSSCAPWYLPKRIKNLRLHKNLYMDIYSSFVHNFQELEAIKMSFSGWIDKLTVVHPHNGVLRYYLVMKWAIKSWKNREEAYMHIIQWKKPIWNGYILYDSKSMTF